MRNIDKLFWDAFSVPTQSNYPPYNIIQTDNNFIIELAASGFESDELNVEYDGKALEISGVKSEVESEELQYVHRGLATRNFRQTFAVRGQFEIGEVTLQNGILTVNMLDKAERVKPKIIVKPNRVLLTNQ